MKKLKWVLILPVRALAHILGWPGLVLWVSAMITLDWLDEWVRR